MAPSRSSSVAFKISIEFFVVMVDDRLRREQVVLTSLTLVSNISKTNTYLPVASLSLKMKLIGLVLHM
jgi:hypothetical protein